MAVNWEILDIVGGDQALTSMFLFWGLMLLTYFLMQNGLSIFNDVTKSMSLFMLEKALGPGIDLVEGREGAASKTWFIQGMLWLIAASTLAFEGLWLKQAPTALHSRSAWGYAPPARSLPPVPAAMPGAWPSARTHRTPCRSTATAHSRDARASRPRPCSS